MDVSFADLASVFNFVAFCYSDVCLILVILYLYLILFAAVLLIIQFPY